MKNDSSDSKNDYFSQRLKRFAKLAEIVPHDNNLNDDVFLDHCLSVETTKHLQTLTTNYISACFREGNIGLSNSEVLSRLNDPRAKLDNLTPNGVLLSKHDTTFEFNLLHKAVSQLFSDLGITDLTEFWQMPLNVRIAQGEVKSSGNRPYDSSKQHSDTWIGEPADMILVNIPILGDIKNTTLNWYLPPEHIGESHLKPLSDYNEGQNIAKRFTRLNVEPRLGHIYFSDPTTLHKTNRLGGKVRVSIDLRFRMKVSPDYRKFVLDTCDQRFLKNYIPTKEFLDIGHNTLVYVSETLDECRSKYSKNASGTRQVAENKQIKLNATCKKLKTLVYSDFSEMFGLKTEHDLPNDCILEIDKHNFSYQELSLKENNQAICDTLKLLNEGAHSIVGSHRQDVWEKGWSENEEDFARANFDIEKLKPKYFKPSPFVRLKGKFVNPSDSNFEINIFTVLRHWVYLRFLSEVDEIYEFGCGTGLNLALLAKLFPSKKLHGLDWTVASQKILKNLAIKFDWKLSGHHFDFFKPDYNFSLAPNSAVMTSTALEQLGKNHEPFVEYLLKRKPKICLHVEPILELYDKDDMLDSIAIKYHQKRGYLEGFLPKLRELEQHKLVEILFTHRMKIGNHLHDGYSIIVWRPLCIQ